MGITKFARPLAAVIIGCCTGAVFAQQQPYIYPTKGQSQQQTEMDKGQCYTWAVQQSKYDPANPPPPPPPPSGGGSQQGGQMAGGLFGGALLGGGIGAISGHAGEGAAIGALFGGLRSARRSQQQQQEQQQQQMAYAQQQQASRSQGLNNYQRAFRACMNGRGYNVD